MKKLTALLLAFCVLGISCQSTKVLSEEPVAIETPPAAPVAKSVVAHTLESVNERIDKNLVANDSNDKTYAITDRQLDSLDALISTKITHGKNDNNDTTTLLLATSIDTTKIEKTLLTTATNASDTLQGTTTNGLLEPLTIVILSDVHIDTQNKDKKTAVILATEQRHVLALTTLVDTSDTLNIMDYKERTALMLYSRAPHSKVFPQER